MVNDSGNGRVDLVCVDLPRSIMFTSNTPPGLHHSPALPPPAPG